MCFIHVSYALSTERIPNMLLQRDVFDFTIEKSTPAANCKRKPLANVFYKSCMPWRRGAAKRWVTLL